MSMPNNDRGMKEGSSVLINAFGIKLISANSGLGDRFGDVGGTGGDAERCCSRQFFSIRPFLLLKKQTALQMVIKMLGLITLQAKKQGQCCYVAPQCFLLDCSQLQPPLDRTADSSLLHSQTS